MVCNSDPRFPAVHLHRYQATLTSVLPNRPCLTLPTIATTKLQGSAWLHHSPFPKFLGSWTRIAKIAKFPHDKTLNIDLAAIFKVSHPVMEYEYAECYKRTLCSIPGLQNVPGAGSCFICALANRPCSNIKSDHGERAEGLAARHGRMQACSCEQGLRPTTAGQKQEFVSKVEYARSIQSPAEALRRRHRWLAQSRSSGHVINAMSVCSRSCQTIIIKS